MKAARRKAEVEEKEAIVNKAHALLILGICCPVGFSAAAVGPASIGSSVARSPHYQSPTSRTTAVSPGFPPPRHDTHTRFSGSPDVSVIAPSTPRPLLHPVHGGCDLQWHFNLWKHSRPGTMTSHSHLCIVWTIINNCPKFKDQYRELQRKRGKKTTKFAGGGDGEALKRSRGKTNSTVDDIRDAASMALHETLHGMMSQKDMRDEKKRLSKDEKMKHYLELQRKKPEMEEAAKKRKIDLEEAARQR
ncbi:ABC transporter C family member 3 [Hordeum vulgare]|nr:ABC transporter C family member 3 [Hordeum vulgare]